MMQRRNGMMPVQPPQSPGPGPGQDVMQQMQQMIALFQKDPAIMVAMMQDPAMRTAMAELMRGFLEMKARGNRTPNGLEMVQRGLADARSAPAAGPGGQGGQMPPGIVR